MEAGVREGISQGRACSLQGRCPPAPCPLNTHPATERPLLTAAAIHSVSSHRAPCMLSPGPSAGSLPACLPPLHTAMHDTSSLPFLCRSYGCEKQIVPLREVAEENAHIHLHCVRSVVHSFITSGWEPGCTLPPSPAQVPFVFHREHRQRGAELCRLAHAAQ